MKYKSKILLAIGSSEIGGAQKVFHNLVKELINKKKNLIVVLPEGDLFEKLKNYEIEIHKINFSSIYSFSKIIQLLRINNIYLINTYLTKCSILFSIINIFFRKAICCSLHNSIIHEKLNFVERKVYPFFYHFLYRISNGIIVSSSYNKNHFSEIAKIPKDFIKVIHNSVDKIENSYNKVNITNSKRKLRIGYIGRLSKEKGVIYLLKSLKVLKKKIDFDCSIIGDGPMREKLELFSKLNLLNDRVKFLGFKSNVYKLIKNLDVIVVPSLNEAFGMTIIEAFSQHKIVIASNIDAIPELIIHKETGLLFPVKDYLKLNDLLIYVYKNKKDVIKIQNNAYKFYINNFIHPVFIDKTLKYFNNLTNNFKG